MRNTTLRKWIKNYNNGLYENKSDDEIWYDPGWIDYHCKESSLTNRLKKMANVIKDIDDNFLLDNYYVCFKNNCPVSNPLYDDFRLIPLEERKRMNVASLLPVVIHAATNTCTESQPWEVEIRQNLNAKTKRKFLKP